MAKFFAVSVRDRAAETFGTPFFVPSPPVAMRHFVNEVNRVDDKNPMFTNSEDFELYHVGSFDDQTGIYTPMVENAIKMIAVGKDVKRVIN